jgi:hypothetical protein
VSLPLTHLKREHFPPEDARSCGILEEKNRAVDLDQLLVELTAKESNFLSKIEREGREQEGTIA